MLKTVWDLLEKSPLGDVFIEYRDRFIASLDDLADYQGEATREETEVAKFMAGISELIMSRPNILLETNDKYYNKNNNIGIIGRRMPDGVLVMPNETLSELLKLKVFNQIPTIDSLTTALDRDGLLIHDTDGRKKYQLRLNGVKTRGWYIKMSIS
jgi:hypothetical protein